MVFHGPFSQLWKRSQQPGLCSGQLQCGVAPGECAEWHGATKIEGGRDNHIRRTP